MTERQFERLVDNAGSHTRFVDEGPDEAAHPVNPQITRPGSSKLRNQDTSAWYHPWGRVKTSQWPAFGSRWALFRGNGFMKRIIDVLIASVVILMMLPFLGIV